MSAAAGRLKVSVEDIKAAKDGGCPGFDSGGRVDVEKVRRWLARHPKAKPSKSKSVADGGVAGLASNLSRLAEEERRLFGLLQAAIGSPAETGARKAWLATAEQLRRADSSLAESRRDSGEFLPRSEVERLLEDFGKLVVHSTRDMVWNVANAVRLSGDPRQAAGEALTPARRWIMNIGAIATGLSPNPIPAWGTEAWGRGCGNGLLVEEGEFVGMTQGLRDVLALAVQNAFAEEPR